MKIFPTLYNRRKSGALQEWTVEITGNKYRVVFGQVGGKRIASKYTIALSKNDGKTNATTGEEQALLEAQRAWDKQVESGYVTDINSATIGEVSFTEPMLAHTYGPKTILTYPVYSQPKLDGVRCICRIDGMFSRNGKPLLSAPHIRASLNKFFKKNPTAVLDGELYTSKLFDNFDKIISLVRKSKPNKEELAESAETIQYWVYDVVDTTKTFKQRFEWLHTNLFELSIKHVVPTPTHIIFNKDQLDERYGEYIESGFEGQMIRLNAVYENDRSKALLKRKEFLDGEYEILDVVEGIGNRSGMAGNFVLRLDDERTFKSNIKGSHSYLKELLSDRLNLIGKMATIKYFNLTPRGVPRFPVAIAVRDYE